MFKRYVEKKLENYAKKYLERYSDIKLIVVTGSVGKTSTKRAIGDVLSTAYRIRMHDSNHNTELAVPLSILGIEYPANVHSIGAWLKVFRACKKRIHSPRDVDVIIQELGTDCPGDIAKFGTYLTPDIAVVTAVTPEHMDSFKTLDEVAKEELATSSFSKTIIVNRDDIDGKYADLNTNPNIYTYGSGGQAEYRVLMIQPTLHEGATVEIHANEWPDSLGVVVNVIGEHSLRPIAAAVAVGVKLGLNQTQVSQGIKLIKPVPGRMNPLHGIGGTTIIDDTYNSSPAAAKAALQALYLFDDESQRIAILGQMNELGESSPLGHQLLGEYCNGDLLAWLVVVGNDAEKYLAPAARARGCQVKVCRDAIEAGEFVRTVSEEGAVILVKGSQTGIYLEEAVKILCNMTEDIQLVRQSEEWMDIKNQHFSRFSN